jgi:hypothetical protein
MNIIEPIIFYRLLALLPPLINRRQSIVLQPSLFNMIVANQRFVGFVVALFGVLLLSDIPYIMYNVQCTM